MLSRHAGVVMVSMALGLGACGAGTEEGTADLGAAAADAERAAGTAGGESNQEPGSGAASNLGNGAAGSTAGSGNGGSGGSPSDFAHHVIPDGPVTVVGRELRVNGTAIHVRGVCWNPVVKGGTHPGGLDFRGLGELDIPLMQAAGINAVRTYTALTDRDVLDELHAAGIKVINSVYVWGGEEPSAAVAPVNAVKDHPAILMWMVGNEWNYNGLYVGLSYEESRGRMQAAAQLIKQADPDHLVATSYGEVPSSETISQLPAIDVWGINTYRGISFGDLFSTWQARSTLPLIISEYGADAYDARDGGSVNLQAQAEATASLAGAIEDAAAREGGVVSGGTLFEWSDEWWKDSAGSPDVQDVGGIAPGGGPHPDATFNEEWWGVVTIDREPRPAYYELQKLFLTP